VLAGAGDDACDACDGCDCGGSPLLGLPVGDGGGGYLAFRFTSSSSRFSASSRCLNASSRCLSASSQLDNCSTTCHALNMGVTGMCISRCHSLLFTCNAVGLSIGLLIFQNRLTRRNVFVSSSACSGIFLFLGILITLLPCVWLAWHYHP
jgi:hypothetical protein